MTGNVEICKLFSEIPSKKKQKLNSLFPGKFRNNFYFYGSEKKIIPVNYTGSFPECKVNKRKKVPKNYKKT